MYLTISETTTELARVLARPGSREERARRAAEWIRRAGGYRRAALYDVGAAEIAILAWSGPEAPAVPRFPRSQGLNGAAVASGRLTLGSTQAEMIMPVKSAGRVVGTIDVESERPSSFGDADRELLEACAETLAPLWAGR